MNVECFFALTFPHEGPHVMASTLMLNAITLPAHYHFLPYGNPKPSIMHERVTVYYVSVILYPLILLIRGVCM